MSLLCETVTASTMADLRRCRDAAADADVVELRLDSVCDPSAAGAVADRRKPVIVTCRPEWEGGQFRGSEEERKKLLAEALALGAEYVDVEWRADFADLIKAHNGRRIVLSSHTFDSMPRDLSSRHSAMRACGAEVVKIAGTAKCLADCLPMFDLGTQFGNRGDLVLIAMGEYGATTRILAARYGSAWTYGGAIGDIGQLSTRNMVKDYRFPSIGGATEVYGIVGGSVGHSVSPAMHNAAFRASGYDAVYVPLPAVDAGDFMTFAKAFGVVGASVTIPHKVSLFEAVDEVDAVSRRIGAINTIRRIAGRWLGANTDAVGFLAPLRQRMSLKGKRASILGAGGAARAAAAALASEQCQVTVHARDRAQAERVAMQTSAAIGPWPPARHSWDLLVNSTPLGQFPRVDETPLPKADLTGEWVYDLVYNPTETRLVREAAQAGCRTIGGLDMLVGQAQEQFAWWTGSRAPAGVMREAALKRLAEFTRDEDHVV